MGLRESSGEGAREWPDFLKALANFSANLKSLLSSDPDCDKVNEALATHRGLLIKFLSIQMKHYSFREKTITEGHALVDLLNDLFGDNNVLSEQVSADFRDLQYPDRLSKDVAVIKALLGMIEKLENLRRELSANAKAEEILEEEIEVLKELPRIFPPGAPIHRALQKRIAAVNSQ